MTDSHIASDQQGLINESAIAGTVDPMDAASVSLGDAGSLPNKGAMIKHYEIIREIGQGGMGVVYLARDTKLGRLVAIKLLVEFTGSASDRFLAEARATARCRHDNIVVIHEVDEWRGCPYMVLEYIEGRTLRAWIDRRPSGADGVSDKPRDVIPATSLAFAVELMIPVARALVCAHEHGIVHRDLKPENILVSNAGAVKVVDFGIAKQMGGPKPVEDGGTHDEDESALGTVAYMAPEQWLGEDLDARVDIWAAGIVLYELCSGHHPLDAPSLGGLGQIADVSTPMPTLQDDRPGARALAAVIDRCLRKSRDERMSSAKEFLQSLEVLRFRGDDRARSRDDNPFAGLSSFQEGDEARFFGRDEDVTAVVSRLVHQPLVVITGSSGAGKSSFVRAGLVPALKRSNEHWEALVLRPGRRPLGALADLISDELPTVTTDRTAHNMVDYLLQRPGFFGAKLRARCRDKSRILLFVDQFEELYTQSIEPAERAAFLACLEGAADDASSPLRVALAVRSDFLDRLADDRKFLSDVLRGLIFLGPLGRESLREALVRPVEMVGHAFESEALVSEMLNALEETRSPLPLLQFTAATLWNTRDKERNLLTRASYEKLGGVAGALSAQAEARFASFSTAEQRHCRSVMIRLVTPERTRAVVSLDELQALGTGEGAESDANAIEQVVQQLVAARLLSLDRSDERDRVMVELVHESLIERWPRLGRWLDESAEDARFLANVRMAAQQWDAGARAEGLLWRDDAAIEARTWLERRRLERNNHNFGLGPRENRFLEAVVLLADRSRRTRRRIAVGVIVGLGAIATLVSILAVRARNEAAHAAEQARMAEIEARRARNASRMATAREQQADPTMVLSLLREVEPPEMPRGWAELSNVALHGGVASAVLTDSSIPMQLLWSADGNHVLSATFEGVVHEWPADGKGEPRIVASLQRSQPLPFDASGKRIMALSKGKLILFSMDEPSNPTELSSVPEGMTVASWSPDEDSLVAAFYDGIVRLWRTDRQGDPVLFRGHTDKVFGAAFSRDGQTIITGSADKTVRIWRVDGTGETKVLRGHEGTVAAVGTCPDGHVFATGSADKTLRVWRIDGEGEPTVLKGYEQQGVVALACSPDNKRIASASTDNIVRIWRIEGNDAPLVFRGHTDQIFSLAWSPDGRRVASVSKDKTVRIWPVDRPPEPAALLRREQVFGVAIRPDGQTFALGTTDGFVEACPASNLHTCRRLGQHDALVFTVSFSPDGKRIASASMDKTVRIWNADGSGEPIVLRGHEARVSGVQWSPDGKRIVSSSWDRTARVWNADGTGDPLILRGSEMQISGAQWSPNGQRIAAASMDGNLRIWNLDRPSEPLTLPIGAAGQGATWSPDGQRIAVGALDGKIRIFQTNGTGLPVTIQGHDSWINSIAWSGDGKRIASASQDKTLRVWFLDRLGEPLVLRADSALVFVNWTPDQKHLLTLSDDRVVRLWSDLEPLRGPSDPRLWRATSYCIPAVQRVSLFDVAETTAHKDEEACRQKRDTLQ